VLSHLPQDLSASAQRSLAALGVQIRNNIHVKDIRAAKWNWRTAKSSAPATSHVGRGRLGNATDEAAGRGTRQGGRIKVNPDLSLPGHPEIFAIGDMALVAARKRQARSRRFAGRDANGQTRGETHPRRNQRARQSQPTRPAFKYWDKGTMATIGRSAAVAWIGRFKFSGWLAWLAWLFIHLIFLIGFRNRLAVLFQWTYSYFSYKRSARIITYLPPDAPR
jgi:NADH dehydrogenase